MKFRATLAQSLNLNALSLSARSALCAVVLAGGTFACADVDKSDGSVDVGDEAALRAFRWRHGAGAVMLRRRSARAVVGDRRRGFVADHS